MKRISLSFISLILCFATALAVLPPAARASAPDISVTAYSAVAMDYDTGEILYAKDIDTMRVPASMTKIMTAYIVFEEMEKGNLTKETPVTISPNVAKMSRDPAYPMNVPLKQGDSYTVDKLLELIMLPSASASCVALAEHISGTEAEFVKLMNETARRLGLEAEFENSHGAKPHYITARSVAKQIRIFIQQYPDILSYTSRTSMTLGDKTYGNTNRLLPGEPYEYEGADGFKSGTIPEAGFCLSATAMRDGRRLITVVMHSSDTNARHTDTQAIMDYGFAEMKRRDEARANTVISLNNYPNSVRLNSEFHVGAAASGADAEYVASVRFTVNGKTVCEYPDATVFGGAVFGLTYCVTEKTQSPLEIKVELDMLNGVKKEALAYIPLSDEEPALYKDINKHWAENEIGVVSAQGVVKGYADGYFRPDNSVTRAEFVTMLGRVAEKHGLYTPALVHPDFLDIEAGQWYSAYIAWAVENGIAMGYGDAFGVSDFISREQMAVMLYNFMRAFGVTQSESGETASPMDAADISGWAAEAVREMYASGLITGYADGSFSPGEDVDRATAAVVLSKLLGLIETEI